MAEEELADYTCLAEFQAAINAVAPVREINALKYRAMDEIERTYAKHLEQVIK